jgi:hypothetical protein
VNMLRILFAMSVGPSHSGIFERTFKEFLVANFLKNEK